MFVTWDPWVNSFSCYSPPHLCSVGMQLYLMLLEGGSWPITFREKEVFWRKGLKMLTGLRARRWCKSPKLLHMIGLQEESLACCMTLPLPHYPLCVTWGIKTTLENKVRALFTETWSPHVVLCLTFWLNYSASFVHWISSLSYPYFSLFSSLNFPTKLSSFYYSLYP